MSSMVTLAPCARWKRFDTWWMASLVFVAIRLSVLVLDQTAFTTDPDAYLAIAEGWTESGTYGRADDQGLVRPTAFRPPLYPWLVSLALIGGDRFRAWMICLHLGLGVATCLLTWLIGRKLIEGEFGWLVSWGASIGVAIDPILLRQSTIIMTETLATFLLVLVWYVWLRMLSLPYPRRLWPAIAVGSLLGLSVLARSSSIVWLPLMISLIIVRYRRADYQRRSEWLKLSMAIAAATIAVLSPWAIRNRMVMGQTIWSTSHGGYTMYLANNPVLFDHFDRENLGRNWNEERFNQLYAAEVSSKTTSELEADRLANRLAWTAIEERPSSMLRAMVARFSWFWAFWPNEEQASRWVIRAIGVYYAIVLLSFVVACGIWIARCERASGYVNEQWIPAITILVGLTIVHLFYWSNMRMRAPVMPVVYLAVTISWLRFANWCRRT